MLRKGRLTETEQLGPFGAFTSCSCSSASKLSIGMSSGRMGGERVDVGCLAHCLVSFVIFGIVQPSAVHMQLVPLNLTVGSRGEEQRMIFL